MNRDEAIALIRGSGLADRLDRIEPYLALGLRIHARRAPDSGAQLVSRFAGCGVLPRGTPWPLWDSSAMVQRWIEYTRRTVPETARASRSLRDEQIERYEAEKRANPKPLNFLAMIRLADIGEHAAFLGLPDRGALLFFHDVERYQGSFWPEARGGSSVMYVPDEGGLELVDSAPIDIPYLVPSALSFEPRCSLPDDISAETGDEDLHVYGNDEYTRVYLELLGGEDALSHQLGGAPREVQNGLFLTCQLAANGVDFGEPTDLETPRAQELAPGARQWRLLLQIDTDEAGPGWMWGDMGRLYFCTHGEDLAARRFDRAWCVEQCH